MINNRWEKRTNVTAVDDDLDPDPGGGGGQEVEMDRQRGDGRADQARLQGRDLQKEAARKKYYFQQKMNLEGNRKSLGSGNIAKLSPSFSLSWTEMVFNLDFTPSTHPRPGKYKFSL